MKSEIKVLLTLSLYITTIVGDYIVFGSKYSYSFVGRAISDNAVHASIGCLSALIFFSHDVNISSEAYLLNVALCTTVSSLIDIDHFIVARSFNLKDLSNLKQRGFLHCTSFWLVITACMFLYSYIYKKTNIYVSTWMLVIAYMSHHIRDSNRRGIWLYPFGHTPPLNVYVYVFLTLSLPHLLSYAYFYMKPFMTKPTVIDYKMMTV